MEINFIVSAWGKKYETLALDFALPSFFSAKTSTLLNSFKNNLIFYTSYDSEIDIKKIGKSVNAFNGNIIIEKMSPTNQAIETLTNCHKHALAKFQQRQKFFFIQADNIFSDNWGKLITDCIQKNKKVIAPFGLRVIEEKVLPQLSSYHKKEFSAEVLEALAIENTHPYICNHSVDSLRHINSGTFILKNGKENHFEIKTVALHPIFIQLKDSLIVPNKSLDDDFWENHVDSSDEIFFLCKNNEFIVLNLSSIHDRTLASALPLTYKYDENEFIKKCAWLIENGCISKKYWREIWKQRYCFGESTYNSSEFEAKVSSYEKKISSYIQQ